MIEKTLYWTTTVCALLAFLLFVTNVSMINGNTKLQAEINQKQVVINAATNVLPLNQQLSNALYDASVKKKDAKLRDLLISQGFTLPSEADKADSTTKK